MHRFEDNRERRDAREQWWGNDDRRDRNLQIFLKTRKRKKK